MADGTLAADTKLLTEIRDLLAVVADHYRDEYDHRLAAREAERRAKIVDLVASAKRRAAWTLADGSRTQRQISRESKLDEGATSKLFKALRELGAVEGELPRRTVEV